MKVGGMPEHIVDKTAVIVVETDHAHRELVFDERQVEYQRSAVAHVAFAAAT